MAVTATLIRRTEYSLVYSAFNTGGGNVITIGNVQLVADSVGLMSRLLQTPVVNGGAMERLFGSDFATSGAFFDNPNILYIEIAVQPTTSDPGAVEPWTARGQRDGAINRVTLNVGQLSAIDCEAEIRLQVRHTYDR